MDKRGFCENTQMGLSVQCVHLTGTRGVSLACPMAQDQPSDGLLTSLNSCTKSNYFQRFKDRSL